MTVPSSQDILSLVQRMTPEDRQEIERELCRRDVFRFIQDYVRIEDRGEVEGKIENQGASGIVIPFKLWPRQIDVLLTLTHERFVMVMKANQLGLTWLILAYATWKILFVPGYSVKAISETETKAKELARRIDFILRYLPPWMAAKEKNDRVAWYESQSLSVTVHHPKKRDRSGKEIEQEDSGIQTFPSSPTAGASFTANLFLFDEWALQQFAREIWTYAFPTVNRPNGGQIIGISTIERGSLFEDLWRAINAFVKLFLPWNSDPRRDQVWYDNTLMSLGLDETRKHYPATVEEALAIPGGAFFWEFDQKVHEKPHVVIPDYYRIYRVIDYGLDTLACYWLWMDTQGKARIYRELHEENLIISEACYKILKLSGAKVPETQQKWDVLSADEKKKIAKESKEKVYLTYAPPDLFKKSQESGRSTSMLWEENGIPLTKSRNDFEEGCKLLMQWLHPIILRDEATGDEVKTAMLTIEEGCAPYLVHSFLNIQKDKHNANVYAKQPHGLTHSCDSIRGWAIENIVPAYKPVEKKHTWMTEHLRRKKFAEPWQPGMR